MSFTTLRRLSFLALPAFLLAATPAAAHHVMGGKMPSTLGEGLLSGLGHPVIGPDHLAFLVAVGIAVGVGGLNLALPIMFVAFSAIGVALHVNGIEFPAAELIVASSVILAGLLLTRGRSVSLGAWAALFGIAGLAHGYAYGESIYGAEPTPLFAYLAGLVVIQSALTIGIAIVTRRSGTLASALAPRLAGAVVLGVGLTALIGQLVPGA